jgi:hypothetical protein
MALRLHQTRFAQQPQVVRDSRLLDRHCRFEVTHTHLTGMPRQHIEYQQTHRMPQDLQVLAQPLRFSRAEPRSDKIGATARTALAFEAIVM